MSRLRENPDKLFEVFVEVGRPNTEDEVPLILQKYPIDYNEEDVLKSVAKFTFPCDTERTTVDHFTFTLTDMDSKFKFGFCRHSTGAQTCLCIVSFLPWFEVFYNFLNILAEVTNRTEDCDIMKMLRAAYVHEVPSSGVPVTVVAGQEMFSFKAPEANKLPSIPGSRNLTEYYNAIDTENMMIIFASMLHERRILVTSKKLSRVTSVIHAAASLLYPMFWQHLFIPVLPSFLIDYLSAPMPYVIGVHAKIMERVKISELGDAVIVDADKNTVSTEFDDVHDLPEDMAHYLKRHLKSDKVKNSMQGTGDIISKTFMMSLVKLIGGYRDALMFHEGETITFNPDAFVQSRPLSMQPFLQNMLTLQIFQQFINDRLDMLNDGRGFADLFEQECLTHADKLNAQTRYNEWLNKMKKQGKKLQRGGKDVWSDFKVKASPYMKEARGMMDIMANRVKTQGKKAYSKAKRQFNDLKKDDGSPKQSKAIRHGEKTKSFSKEKPSGIIKDRPTTIVGTTLKLERPPRPGVPPPTVSERTRPKTVPRAVIRQASIERSQKLLSQLDVDKRVSSDDSDLLFSRVSVNLLGDPDIQNAMFKSASAENLPKTDPTMKGSDSSDTITSTSSLENETERSSILFMDDDEHDGSHSKKDNFNIQYTNLMNDDDSGIVMQSDSHLSLDKSKGDSVSSSNLDSRSPFAGTTLHASKSESQIPPPRPPSRKTVSPDVAGSFNTPGDISVSRERPAIKPRKKSLESSLPRPGGDILIDFENQTSEPRTLASEFDELSMHPAGDYVLLREPITPKAGNGINEGNRRSSISRTPVMKLGQQETPKRPSIRRERSPVTPDESPEKEDSLLNFDPLLGSAHCSSPQLVTQSSDVSDDNDSLLKDWDIGGLTKFSNTPQQNPVPNQLNLSYTHPIPQPRTHVNPHLQTQFYSPQPYMPPTQPVSAPLSFQNILAQHTKARPCVPPRPKPKPSSPGPGAKVALFPSPVSSKTEKNQTDPFADLLNLNQATPQETSQKSNWETFN